MLWGRGRSSFKAGAAVSTHGHHELLQGVQVARLLLSAGRRLKGSEGNGSLPSWTPTTLTPPLGRYDHTPKSPFGTPPHQEPWVARKTKLVA